MSATRFCRSKINGRIVEGIYTIMQHNIISDQAPGDFGLQSDPQVLVALRILQGLTCGPVGHFALFRSRSWTLWTLGTTSGTVSKSNHGSTIFQIRQKQVGGVRRPVPVPLNTDHHTMTSQWALKLKVFILFEDWKIDWRRVSSHCYPHLRSASQSNEGKNTHVRLGKYKQSLHLSKTYEFHFSYVQR